MDKIYAVIPCAGSGIRTGLEKNKLFYKVENEIIVRKTVLAFSKIDEIDTIIVVYKDGEKETLKKHLKDIDKKIKYVLGGACRFDSVKNALSTLKDGIVIIHDGARPFIKVEDIKRCIRSTQKYGSGILATNLIDTVCQTDGDDNVLWSTRKNRYAILTPQTFYVKDIKKAYSLCENPSDFTDDSGLFCSYIGKCKLVKTDNKNPKITYKEDLLNSTPKTIGNGFDLHKLVENRKLILGGIEIPHDKGLLGHSDADVLTHAIMDALLSGASLRDIGFYFSDKDAKYKDISSIVLLRKVMKMIKAKNLKPIHVSAVIMAEKPKLSSIIPKIIENLANELELSTNDIGITATTLEGIGTVGREEGIAVSCYALLGEF